MADVFTKTQRSAVMRAVQGRQTGPEQVVAEIVAGLRFRPRQNEATLPGSPDFAFVRRKKLIFVHGCFWHRHACPAGRSMPASNEAYWLAKFARNRRRDARVRGELRDAGWQVLVVWECQTRQAGRARLTRRIRAFLRDE